MYKKYFFLEMTLDVSFVDISKIAAIFTPKYKNGYTIYILFTLWPYLIMMHVFFAVYDIVALEIDAPHAFNKPMCFSLNLTKKVFTCPPLS